VVLAGTIEPMASPEHRVCAAGVTVATGVGLTVTVAVIGVPEQPFAIGVIVKVTITGEFVVLVNVPLMSPEPEAAIPDTDAVLFLVQLYVVPGVMLFS
jgi:hypothetical protein